MSTHNSWDRVDHHIEAGITERFGASAADARSARILYQAVLLSEHLVGDSMEDSLRSALELVCLKCIRLEHDLRSVPMHK